MKRILDINPHMELKIEEIIKTKGFRDFDHFVTVALENQVALETSNSTINGVSNIIDSQISQINKAIPNRNLSIRTMNDTEELIRMPNQTSGLTYLSIPENPNNILWGQYYRFLPVKVGARVLMNMYHDQIPEIRDFTEMVTKVALSFRYQLAKLDRSDRRSFGELLSASFPTHDEKSIKRFVNQYMLYLRTSDMTLLGMMPELKLINVVADEKMVVRIGLTKFGSQFALLQNPAIDLNRPESFSNEEIDFLVNHIADNLPAEFEHMTIALKTIKDGKTTRDELNIILKEYYVNYHKGEQWSDAVVNTMRSGLMGRLNELGLARRQKHGKNIHYYITDAGEKYIQSISDKDEIRHITKDHQGKTESLSEVRDQ